MRGTAMIGAFLLGLLALLAADVGAQTTQTDPDAAKSRVATAQEYIALGRYAEVVGTLRTIDPSAGTLTFSIEQNKLAPPTGSPSYIVGRTGVRPLSTVLYMKKEQVDFELRFKSEAPLRKQSL